MAAYDNIRMPWPGWQIVDEIGEGGYGKVYEIERTQAGITERAALKIISIPKNKADYDSIRFSMDTERETEEYFAEKRESILSEIKSMQSLKGGANIVGIDDWAVLEKENGPGWDIYIRMELLTSMQSVFKAKTATEKDVIKLGIDICTALEQCEKRGLIHRDIKPNNILVTEAGDYKLADFGIARTLDHTTQVTGVGTPSYMTPEIYNGGAADKTVDLYSLGLVMYELLNDRRLPFVPKKYTLIDVQAAVTRRMSGEEIPAPANGSNELKKAVLKACAFDPKDRFRTAREMRKALVRVAEGERDSSRSAVSGVYKRKTAASGAEKTANAWSDTSKTVAAAAGVGSGPKKNNRTQKTQAAADADSASKKNRAQKEQVPAGDKGAGKSAAPASTEPKQKKIKPAFIAVIAAMVIALIIGLASGGGGSIGGSSTTSDSGSSSSQTENYAEEESSDDTSAETGITDTTTTDYSVYEGYYQEDIGIEGAYNELTITEVKGDDIYFEASFYRLMGCEGVAVAAGGDTATFTVEEDFPDGTLTGTMVFGGDQITLIFDDQAHFYFDYSLSEYIEGLSHIFKKAN